MISWLVDLNKLQSIINDNPSEVLMGHFDIVGYQYNKHTICETGINQDIFINKFKTVFSGHFHKHTKRTIDTTTICYIGSPWQIDRNDIGEDRGYIIYDVELKTIEQIVNVTTPRFVNIQYPESLKDIKNNIIDLTITYDSNNFDDEKLQFDSYIETLESLNPYKLNINYESINNLNLDDSNNSKTISFNDFKNSFLQFLNTKNLQEFEINELHYKFSNEYDKETM
jgi:DNA repair exonuclease SbcCD nuclease subunit